LGLPTGLTKKISQWESENNNDIIKAILSSSITLVLLVSLTISVFVITFNAKFSSLLLGDEGYYHLIILVALSFPFISLISIFDSYLRGMKRFSLYVKLSISYNLATLAISILSVYLYGLKGVAFSIFLSSFIGFCIYILILKKNKLLDISFPARASTLLSRTFRGVLFWGFASLVIGLSDLGNIIFVRTTIVNEFGIIENGIYQAVSAISNNYLSIFFLAVSFYILPVLSAMKSKEEINKEINNFFRLTLFIIVPIIALTFVFREVIIIILYSNEFISTTRLFVYTFIGDFFKTLSWVLGVWLIPAGKISLWVTIGVSYNLLQVFGFLFLKDFFQLKLESVVISYLIASIILFILNLFLIKKGNKFKFEVNNIKGFCISALCITIIISLSLWKPQLSYYLVVPIISAWFFLKVSSHELRTIKKYIADKLNALTNVR